MDFRNLIDKLDSIASEAKKEVQRKEYKTAADVIADINDAVFAEPSKSQIKYSSANIKQFTDERAEIAFKLSELAQLIKNNDELSLFISKVGNMVHDSEKKLGPELVKVIQAAMEKHKELPLEKDPDSEIPYKDDNEDEFESTSTFKSDIAKSIEEEDQLNERGELEILWDEEPIKRGGGMYQAIRFADGRKSYVPMAVDGRPIWTGKVTHDFQVRSLLDKGFGLPAYKYGQDFDPDFQGEPPGWQGNSEYTGTHRKVGSRWVALDQYKHWSKSDDGNFYTDRNEALADLSFAEWKQAGEIRNINHELKMLALKLQAVDATDKLEWREAILTVNRAYRGDEQAFADMTQMVEQGTDIQVMIAGSALRGKKELADLVNKNELDMALQSKSHAEKMANVIKNDAEDMAAELTGKAGTYGTDSTSGDTRYKGDTDMAKNAQTSQSGGNLSGRNKPRTTNVMPDLQFDGMYEDDVSESKLIHQRRIQSDGNTVNFNIDKSKPVTKAKYQGKHFEIFADPEEIEKWLNSHHSNGWTIEPNQDGTTSKATGNPVKVGKQTTKVGTQPTTAKTGGNNAASKIDPDKWKEIEKLIKQATNDQGEVEKTSKNDNTSTNTPAKEIDPKSPEAKELFRDLELESIQNESEEITEWFNGLNDVTLHGDEFYESFGWIGENEEHIEEAEYQGRTVKLNKPMRGDVKKFKVYVKNPKGNVVKVNFGDPDMKIKRSNPERRKSFRARHNCDSPGPKHKARYWSCRKW